MYVLYSIDLIIKKKRNCNFKRNIRKCNTTLVIKQRWMKNENERSKYSMTWNKRRDVKRREEKKSVLRDSGLSRCNCAIGCLSRVARGRGGAGVGSRLALRRGGRRTGSALLIGTHIALTALRSRRTLLLVFALTVLVLMGDALVTCYLCAQKSTKE